jgi:hypothetical protein
VPNVFTSTIRQEKFEKGCKIKSGKVSVTGISWRSGLLVEETGIPRENH